MLGVLVSTSLMTIILTFPSDWWVGDESCRSSHGAWSARRADHLYQFSSCLSFFVRLDIDWFIADSCPRRPEGILHTVPLSESRTSTRYTIPFASFMPPFPRSLVGLTKASTIRRTSSLALATSASAGRKLCFHNC